MTADSTAQPSSAAGLTDVRACREAATSWLSVGRARRIIVAWLVTVTGLALLLLAVSAPTRQALRTSLLVPRLIGFRGWLFELGSSRPVHEDVTLQPVYGSVTAHIVRPPHGRHPVLIVCLGLAPGPVASPRIQDFLDGIARSGIAVVLLDSQVMRNSQLFPDLPQVVVEGVQFAAAQPYADRRRIGVFGVSMGAPIVLAAVARPEIRDLVRAVDASSGLDSVQDAIVSVTSHTLDDDGTVRPWQPSLNAQRVVRDALASTLENPDERAALRRAFFERPAMALDRSALSPGAQAVYDLLSRPDRATAAALLDRLSPLAQEAFAAISPSAYLGQLHAPLFVMYDRTDNVLPYTGSRELCRQAAASHLRVQCAEFSHFGHIVRAVGAGNPLISAHDLAGLFFHVLTFERAIE